MTWFVASCGAALLGAGVSAGFYGRDMMAFWLIALGAVLVLAALITEHRQQHWKEGFEE
jgi:hypothetical protein